MAITYGLTADGLVIKSLGVIRDDISSALRAAFGVSIDLGDLSIFGVIVGIIAERFSNLWELVEAVYGAGDSTKATGKALEALSALTGTTRPEAESSTVTLTLTGDQGTLVQTGKQANTVSTSDPQNFATTVDATLVALDAYAANTAYALDARVTSSNRAYQCITAGTSSTDGAGAPVTTAASIGPDGTVYWQYLGEGTAVADVAALSVNTGAITGLAGDITGIATSVSGWRSVTNLLDAVPGRDVGTDDELRTLRDEEITSAGSGTADAIRAQILKITGVTAVTIFENLTDATDSNGVPPHAIECLVSGGADQDIGNLLESEVPAGIVTYADPSGTPVAVTVVDEENVSHTINFSRPTPVTIYAIVNLSKDPDNYPADGNTQVQAAIVNAAAKVEVTGKDAVASWVGAQSFQVAGVLDVTSTYIGTAPSPASSTTVSITDRQIASIESTNITVNATDGTV